MIRDLLIDADMYLFQAASAVEEDTDWGNDLWTLHSDLTKARRVFKERIERFQDELGGIAVLCFSDPTRKTFRHDLSPLYKAKRGRKPVAYSQLRDELLETRNYKCIIKPRLEADDVMGIVSTRAPGRFIIISGDKDMQSIPGHLYRDGKVVEISKEQADRYHLIQTLTGDVTDGYSGCPGIGAVRAEKIVQGGWPGIVEAFKKAGLTEKDALLQARLARILRSEDWDFDKGEVKLWKPTM